MRARTRALLIVAIVLMFAPGLSATAIIVFRSDQHIIVASDSAETHRGAETETQLRCKVKPTGRWWLTGGGYSGSSTFDVWDLAIRALSPAQTMAAVKRALIATVYPRLSAEFKNARSVRGFSELYQAGNQVSQLVVAGVDSDMLTVGIFLIMLDAVEPLALRVVWLACPGAWCDEDGRVHHGASVAADGPAVAHLKPPLAPWVERGDSAAALRIISEQIKASPKFVSGPIDVLELSARGSRWVQRDTKSRCAPIVNR